MPLLCIYFDKKIITPRLQQRNSCRASCVPTPSTSVGTHSLPSQDCTSTPHRCFSETFNGCDFELSVQCSLTDASVAWRYTISATTFGVSVAITIVADSGRRHRCSCPRYRVRRFRCRRSCVLWLRVAASGNICCATSPQFQRSPFFGNRLKTYLFARFISFLFPVFAVLFTVHVNPVE